MYGWRRWIFKIFKLIFFYHMLYLAFLRRSVFKLIEISKIILIFCLNFHTFLIFNGFRDYQLRWTLIILNWSFLKILKFILLFFALLLWWFVCLTFLFINFFFVFLLIIFILRSFLLVFFFMLLLRRANILNIILGLISYPTVAPWLIVVICSYWFLYLVIIYSR